MRVHRSLVLGAPLAVLFACAPVVETHFLQLKPPPRPPTARSPESVEVFTTPRIDRPYAEVGIITEGFETDLDVFLRQVRVEAAKHGCDAVYLQTAGGSKFAGTCLMYTDTPPPKP